MGNVMSFKDLSKMDAPNTVNSDGKLKIEPESKAPGKTPTDGTPAPKNS